MHKRTHHLDDQALEAREQLKKRGFESYAAAVRASLIYAVQVADRHGIDELKNRNAIPGAGSDDRPNRSKDDSSGDPGDIERAPSLSALRDGSGETPNPVGLESNASDDSETDKPRRDDKDGEGTSFWDEPMFGGILEE